MLEWRHLCIGRLRPSGRATLRVRQASDRRLLLRQTVKRAKTENEIPTVNANYGPSGKCVGDDVERDAVVNVVKHWHQHKSICDVEVGVAGRKALPVEIDRGGHGELDYAQGLAGLVGGFLQQLKVLAQRFVIWVARVGFVSRDDHVGRDEARDVVHVAVSVVASDAAAQPDDLADAEIVGKYLLELSTGRAGIARLDVAEQALLRGEERTSAVDVNAAALQYDPSRFAFDLQKRLPDVDVSVYNGPNR